MKHLPIRFIVIVFLGTLFLNTADQAWAAEGGQIHYLLGSAGFQAGLIPPEPGTYFKNQAYFYDGSANAQLRGGQVALNLNESEFIDLLYITQVTNVQIINQEGVGAACRAKRGSQDQHRPSRVVYLPNVNPGSLGLSPGSLKLN